MGSKFIEVRRSARFSKCGRYRWSLDRTWADGNGQTVCFVMLNPSTADHRVDDPTIRRCMGFARDWDYSRLVVRNLFAVRATNPKDLLRLECPTGGWSGDRAIQAAARCDLVVAAWGAFVPFDRLRRARELLSGVRLVCLGETKNGSPRHPLYIAQATPLAAFDLKS